MDNAKVGETSTYVSDVSGNADAELEHVVVMNDDEPAECTIFPHECTDDEILTNWVTAQSGSFVPLETMR